VQRGNIDSVQRNPEGWAGGFKNYNSYLWEMPCLLWATEVPSRSGGPLGRNIEALGFDDAIIVATSLQTPILRNASPLRMMTLFNYCVPAALVDGLVVVWQMTCQRVMTVTSQPTVSHIDVGEAVDAFQHHWPLVVVQTIRLGIGSNWLQGE
jgi:hypothetical protein